MRTLLPWVAAAVAGLAVLAAAGGVLWLLPG